MIPKQDRQGVRQAKEIEQKYNLNNDYTEIKNIAVNAQRAASNAQSVSNNAATDAAIAKATADGFAKDISTIMDRLIALESAVIAVVAVTDTQSETKQLLGSVGVLSVSGHMVNKPGESIIVPGGNAVVTYILTADIGTARTVTINGTSVGAVLTKGDSVSSTVPVGSGDEISIAFSVV